MTVPAPYLPTRRELRILELIALGLTNQQIADQLGTTRGRLDGRVHRLLVRLGAINRAHAVDISWREGHLGKYPGGPR